MRGLSLLLQEHQGRTKSSVSSLYYWPWGLHQGNNFSRSNARVHFHPSWRTSRNTITFQKAKCIICFSTQKTMGFSCFGNKPNIAASWIRLLGAEELIARKIIFFSSSPPYVAFSRNLSNLWRLRASVSVAGDWHFEGCGEAHDAESILQCSPWMNGIKMSGLTDRKSVV